MENFAAIDFESANNECGSVCSVGLVIVKNGKIVKTFYSLIQPRPNYYNYWCSRVHGLTREDTEEAPMFSNTVVVPVFKTASTIDGFYTLDEVTNDVEPSLTANVLNTNVEMTVSNNPSIYYYTLMRGVNAAPGEMISQS